MHSILIDKFGGLNGVRDIELLESAIGRPYATFDGKELYPTVIDKAAILESLLLNHPFIDGNKRIGYVMTRLILLDQNLDIKASQDEKYEFIISITKGEKNFETIKEWLTSRAYKKG
ncbi:MAG: type II toxin-antitoxin system death-on-curing family toxin [Flavobacteriales bacterium]|nr:type II toxin-antitoxin system death-on-curing family toxin [Flavobacteriales bacterium]